MINFSRLATGLNIEPAWNAIQRLEKQGELWRPDTHLRKIAQGPEGAVDSIILRFPRVPEQLDDQSRLEWYQSSRALECHDTPMMGVLPQVRPLIWWLMGAVEGERLGRVVINRLNPYSAFYPHADGEPHASYYDRFHVVLQGTEDSYLTVEDEKVRMSTGEAWWFNNAKLHQVDNCGHLPRIHLIVDIRTRGFQ